MMILLSAKCDEASGMWQQLELASEPESDLRETGEGSGLLISVLEKLKLVSFERFNNTGTIDEKVAGSVLEKKSSFQLMGLSFSSKLD